MVGHGFCEGASPWMEPYWRLRTPYESVPVIHPKAAMNPTFASDDLQETTGFTKALLRRLKTEPPETRKLWVRFIAVKADKALSAPMSPRVQNGSVLLVDRHYCSLDEHLKNGPNLYLIHKDEVCMVRRVEMQGSQLCLRQNVTTTR
jgi:hypothetical protein